MGKYSQNHTEYFNKDGVEIPSVTTVIKILNKPSLVGWANYLGFKRQNYNDILMEKAELGTCFHDMAYCYLQKEKFDRTKYNDCVVNSALIYLDKFITFVSENNFNPVFQEKALTSELYGGTIDYYGEFNGKKMVIDFKTSKRPYSSHFLQLGAYTKMCEENGYEVDAVGVICCNPKVSIKIMTRDEISEYIETFDLIAGLFHKWFPLSLKDKWGNILK